MSLAKLQDLTGRVAVVTGGSRGLGLQMAEVLGGGLTAVWDTGKQKKREDFR